MSLKEESSVEVITERVDDTPLLLGIMMKLELPMLIDKCFPTHGNWTGLSLGWLITIWLSYILTEHDHRMNHVQEWINKRKATIEQVAGVQMRETDLTDDRLAIALRYLSLDREWQELERTLSAASIRVYQLPTETVRLDASVYQTNHNEDESEIFKRGRTKNESFEIQFKTMLATLDPLGYPLAIELVAGNRADDPLYLPIYHRVRQILATDGLLYVGDCKMAAILTRATIVQHGDYYLVPLPQTSGSEELQSQIERFLADKVTDKPVYRLSQDDDEQVPNLDSSPTEDEKEEKGPIAYVFSDIVSRSLHIGEQSVNWKERLLVVRSPSYEEAQKRAFDNRLTQAEMALRALTPERGKGKRQYKEEAPLKAEISRLLKKYRVQDFFEVTYEREETVRQIRGYKGKPSRRESYVRYQIYLTRHEDAISKARGKLGWRLYVTNAPSTRLSDEDAVLSSRNQIIVEDKFARLNQLGMAPLYVQRDDHARGLVRLLTVALSIQVLLEFAVRKKLAAEKKKLDGIYAGQPTRSSNRPTSARILYPFRELTFTLIRFPSGKEIRHLSDLSVTQQRILSLLDLPLSLYTQLLDSPSVITETINMDKFDNSTESTARVCASFHDSMNIIYL